MKRLVLPALFILAGCGGGPQPADWQLDAAQSMGLFQRYYLSGDARADAEFLAARRALASTGREDLVARAELVRCAVRTASLEFDECPGFLALRPGAAPAEIEYWEYLTGKRERAAPMEPLGRLVAAGVQLRRGSIRPETIAQAVEAASAQGWRRPLLAWLGVQEKRARDAGDDAAAAAIRRRIELVAG